MSICQAVAMAGGTQKADNHYYFLSAICLPSSAKENRALAGPVQFAGVGAPTTHLPEGNSCEHYDRRSGRMWRPRAVQQVASMRVAVRARNATAHMPAMRSSQGAQV